MDIKTVSAIAGHSSVSFTLDTYGHVLEEHKRESMKLMNKIYMEEIEQKEHKYAISVKQNDKNNYLFQSVDFPEIQYIGTEMLSGMNTLTQNIKQLIHNKFHVNNMLLLFKSKPLFCFAFAAIS